jgi:hypothetical protein
MPPDSNAPSTAQARRSFIAPLWHTFSILLIFGYFSFKDAQHAQSAAPAEAAARHAAVLRGYLLSIFYEWGMAFGPGEECSSRAATCMT